MHNGNNGVKDPNNTNTPTNCPIANAYQAKLTVSELQRINYHASQLPFAPQCPGAPKLDASLKLPELNN